MNRYKYTVVTDNYFYPRTYKARTLNEASIKHRKLIDRYNLCSSECGVTKVYENKKLVAKVYYNGRVETV